jgi:hypothetical protein
VSREIVIKLIASILSFLVIFLLSSISWSPRLSPTSSCYLFLLPATEYPPAGYKQGSCQYNPSSFRSIDVESNCKASQPLKILWCYIIYFLDFFLKNKKIYNLSKIIKIYSYRFYLLIVSFYFFKVCSKK